MAPPTGAWPTHQAPPPCRIPTLLPPTTVCLQLLSQKPVWRSWNFFFSRPHRTGHGHSACAMFMSPVVQLCPENTASFWSFSVSGFYSLSASSSKMAPEPFRFHSTTTGLPLRKIRLRWEFCVFMRVFKLKVKKRNPNFNERQKKKGQRKEGTNHGRDEIRSQSISR